MTLPEHNWPRPEPQPSDAYAASVAFFEHSLDGVLFTAPDGRIFDANAAACALLARSREDICAGGRIALLDPSDTRWQDALADRRRTGRFAGLLSFRRGDGTSIELDTSSAVFADADGELRTVVVLREADPAGAAHADAGDPALVDPSGVSNRPAFVHLAEQQCRNAARTHLALALVYIQLTRADEHGESVEPGAPDRRELVKLLEADRQWGDVIGRVGTDQFAILLRNDGGDVSALVNTLYARRDAHKRATKAPLQLHVGVKNFESDARTSIVALLDDAAARMAEHVASDHAHGVDDSSRCHFALDRGSEPAHDNVLESNERPGLTDRENGVLRLLASRRSYEEIAHALFVSVNTVKTHVSHVYAKLGVNNRKDAIERADAIGLLSGRGLERVTARRDADAVDFGRIALVAEALTAAQDAEAILDIIVMQGLAGLAADRALVAFLLDNMLVPVASYGYGDASISRFLPAPLDGNLPLAVAVRDQTIVWVASPDEARRRFPEMKDMWPTEPRAWINAPLVTRGRAYGGFAATFLGRRKFSDADRVYLRSLTNLSALALHNLRTRARHA